MHTKIIRSFSIRFFFCLLAAAGVFLTTACQQGGVTDTEEAAARLDTFKKHQEMRSRT